MRRKTLIEKVATVEASTLGLRNWPKILRWAGKTWNRYYFVEDGEGEVTAVRYDCFPDYIMVLND